MILQSSTHDCTYYICINRNIYHVTVTQTSNLLHTCSNYITVFPFLHFKIRTRDNSLLLFGIYIKSSKKICFPELVLYCYIALFYLLFISDKRTQK